MAVLYEILKLDPEATWPKRPELPPTTNVPADVPTPPSPRADDTESEVKPLEKSKTIWGGIIAWLGGMSAAFVNMFQYLATPWGFAALVFITLVLSIGLYLVIKGRLDVQKVLKHLSQDDADG
jgi:hypothetical protein